MSDNSDLKAAATYAAQDIAKFADESEEMRALQQFHEEVSPETVLALIAENEDLCAKVANLNVSGFAEAFYTVAAELGITGARPASPMHVFASEVLPKLQSAIQDAERYRWIRDKSEAVHQFYLSVPLWFTGVRFRAQDVDKAIDAMSKGEQP